MGIDRRLEKRRGRAGTNSIASQCTITAVDPRDEEPYRDSPSLKIHTTTYESAGAASDAYRSRRTGPAFQQHDLQNVGDQAFGFDDGLDQPGVVLRQGRVVAEIQTDELRPETTAPTEQRIVPFAVNVAGKLHTYS